ncbi:unnamed protein product [Absidia cylindrospora]
MRRFITIHFPLYFLLISIFKSSSLSTSILAEASPVSDTNTKLWRRADQGIGSHHLSKRITSIFPNTGHDSTTFNVIHVIAAVIGIVGATLLMIVLVLYYKRKRRRLIAEAAEAATNTSSPYGLPPATTTTTTPAYDNKCRSSLKPQLSIPGALLPPNRHCEPSSAMSQFQVFQSDYYYDDEKQNLQTEKLIQNQPCASSSSSSSSSSHQFMPSSPPPSCHTAQRYNQHHPYTSIFTPSSPPPYKP